MAQTSKIIVEDVNVHPHTGYITIRVKTVTKTDNAEWSGPIRGYGVDAAWFAGRFKSDIEQLKSHVATQHRAYTGVHLDLVEKLGKMKGEVIG